MATLKAAVKKTPRLTRTTNDMKALESTTNPNVDLFYKIGASRGNDITSLFESAYQENRLLSLRTLAWARDVRGGAGERQTFRSLLQFIEENHPKELAQLVKLTPEYGRWDDLLALQTPKGLKMAYAAIKTALKSKNNSALCAKWMPRKGPHFYAMRKLLKLTPKKYRKLLVKLTNVVETQMCDKEWTGIKYGKVPSLAAARYQKAFAKNDPTGYAKYQERLKKGKDKVNAGAVYPYDVIKSLRHGGEHEVIKAQWKALPNYLGKDKILPMVDVSGSMGSPVGGNKNLSCLDVAISLGLYLSDKVKGDFKDMFLTFSGKSKIEILNGDIVSKFHQLERAHWDMNTNLHSAFEAILTVATKNKVKAKDMPAYILILSDMQFDQCVSYDDSAIEMIRRKYENEGYKVPNIIFWNLNAAYGNAPVQHNEQGAALVSGFSPAVVKSILSAKPDSINPYKIMLAAINAKRYAKIK